MEKKYQSKSRRKRVMIQAECARLVVVRFALFCDDWIQATQSRPYSWFPAFVGSSPSEVSD